MAENSAEPTEPGHGPGSNIDTRQLSVESLKDAILESLSRFSDDLVSVLDTKLTQIHKQFAVKRLITRQMRRMQTLHENLLQKGQGPGKLLCPTCQQHLADRNSGGVSPEPEEDRVSIYADEEGLSDRDTDLDR